VVHPALAGSTVPEIAREVGPKNRRVPIAVMKKPAATPFACPNRSAAGSQGDDLDRTRSRLAMRSHSPNAPKAPIIGYDSWPEMDSLALVELCQMPIARPSRQSDMTGEPSMAAALTKPKS
jgi:hypothetical protein